MLRWLCWVQIPWPDGVTVVLRICPTFYPVALIGLISLLGPKHMAEWLTDRLTMNITFHPVASSTPVALLSPNPSRDWYNAYHFLSSTVAFLSRKPMAWRVDWWLVMYECITFYPAFLMIWALLGLGPKPLSWRVNWWIDNVQSPCLGGLTDGLVIHLTLYPVKDSWVLAALLI
jgi:hypothetical protein